MYKSYRNMASAMILAICLLPIICLDAFEIQTKPAEDHQRVNAEMICITSAEYSNSLTEVDMMQIDKIPFKEELVNVLKQEAKFVINFYNTLIFNFLNILSNDQNFSQFLVEECTLYTNLQKQKWLLCWMIDLKNGKIAGKALESIDEYTRLSASNDEKDPFSKYELNTIIANILNPFNSAAAENIQQQTLLRQQFAGCLEECRDIEKTKENPGKLITLLEKIKKLNEDLFIALEPDLNT